MHYVDILYSLSKIESIVYEVYEQEDEDGECSLSYDNLYDINFYLNQIRQIINDKMEKEEL